MDISPKIGKQKRGAKTAVGEDLAAVLPQEGTSFWRTPYLVKLNLVLLIPMVSAATVGFDGAMMNALQIDPYWKKYFNHPSGAKLGGINAIYPVGKVCGLAIVTPLSDKFGRRPLLLAAFLICIIGSVIQGSSVNFGMLIFSRWFIGVGTAMMAQPSPILVAELAYPTHRGKMTSLYNTFYYFGAIFAAWLTYGAIKIYKDDWSWRIPSILQAGLPAVQLLFSVFFLRESPRWLVANGKSEQARSILTRYHAGGDATSPLVDFEMSEIEETIRQEREAEKSSVKHLVIGPANRKRTAIAFTLGLFSQWVGNGVVTYYLTLVLDAIGITNATNQSLINGGLQIFNFAVSVFVGALMVDRLGRRVLFLWSAAGMCISYMAWTILTSQFAATKSTSVGIAVIPMIFIFYFHYDIAFTPLVYAYPTEIFPYALRGLGVTLTYLIGHLGLIVSLFVNPIAMKNIGWRYYTLFCVLNALLFVIIWFLFPETRGHTLEEIAFVFEGDGAAVEKGLPDPLELGAKERSENGEYSEVEVVGKSA